MNVLLVEDEPQVRSALARWLTAQNHRVTEVSSSVDAVALATSVLFDAMAIDINLPDGTGWDVCLAARNGANAGTRLIVMSAVYPSVSRIREFRPESVLLKPFPLESLARAVVPESSEEMEAIYG